MAKRKVPPTVSEAVDRDLDAIRLLDSEIADSALAASARVLATELDSSRNSATSKSMLARELREAMDRLRELTPAKREDDKVDDLSRARDARRARSTGGPRAKAARSSR